MLFSSIFFLFLQVEEGTHTHTKHTAETTFVDILSLKCVAFNAFNHFMAVLCVWLNGRVVHFFSPAIQVIFIFGIEVICVWSLFAPYCCCCCGCFSFGQFSARTQTRAHIGVHNCVDNDSNKKPHDGQHHRAHGSSYKCAPSFCLFRVSPSIPKSIPNGRERQQSSVKKCL